MRAFAAAVDAALVMATAIGVEDQLDDPGARLELARRLREEAQVLHRQALALEALSLGLSVGAEVEVDAGREVSTTEEEG